MADMNNEEKWAAIEDDEIPATPVPGEKLPGGLLAAGAALGSVNTGGMGIAGAGAYSAAVAEANENDLAAAKTRQKTGDTGISEAQSEVEASELNG